MHPVSSPARFPIPPIVVRWLSAVAILVGAGAALAADARSDCAIAALPQSARTPQMANAARTLAATNPCEVVPNFKAKSITSVWNSLLSSTRTGGRRLDTPVPPGAPQGLMLPQGESVHFDFQDVAGEQLRSLKIEVDQKPLLALANPAAQIDLPVRGFGPDQVFTWTLTTGRGAYRAEFKLAAAADRQEVESRLARLRSQPLDDITRLFYTAAIYDDADLFAQRDRVLAEIRRATGI